MMIDKIEPGRYVVAVSGGVDSVVLLDMLVVASCQSPVARTGDKRQETRDSVQLIVAHYDHGIRPDSALDRKLVQDISRSHGLNFIYDEGHLGADTSEAAARKARYDFLHKVREAAGAKAIITAHHEDDALETAILNIMRGTGRKGLASLKSREQILRPLLHLPKTEIMNYAKQHQLQWREDPSNQDLKYLRNYIRHKILPKFSQQDRQKLSQIVTNTRKLNEEIENLLIGHLHVQPALNQLDRHWFTMLPHQVAREIMAAWLRRHSIRDFTTQTLDRLIVAGKTFKTGQTADINSSYKLEIGRQRLKLEHR